MPKHHKKEDSSEQKRDTREIISVVVYYSPGTEDCKAKIKERINSLVLPKHKVISAFVKKDEDGDISVFIKIEGKSPNGWKGGVEPLCKHLECLGYYLQASNSAHSFIPKV